MADLLTNYFAKIPAEERNSGAIAYLATLDHIAKSSPRVAKAIIQELCDQRSHLKLIASENYSSLAVQLAMGNLLTDKYAEGAPFHRFYAGCENVDAVEELARQELISLYGAECAYVQPHSGADANLVAFWSILMQRVQNRELQKYADKKLDDLSPEEYENIRQLLVNQKVMGLSLNSGGHLTHGYRHNVSSKMMKAVLYDVDPTTELLDYVALSEQVKREKPLILLAGYSAYPRRLNFATLRAIADSVGAVLMVDMAHFSGLVAGKVFVGEENPVPYAHIVTSTTHKTLRGPRGGFILCTKEFEDVVNKGCPLVLGGPLPHVLAAKAIAFQEANTAGFQAYATQVVLNTQALGASLMARGMRLVTGGTDNHLAVVDLTSLGLTGRQGEIALRHAGITVNRNAIPFDKNGPWYTSGIRVGSPALTTLGMKEPEMREIGNIIADLLTSTHPATTKQGEVSKTKLDYDNDIVQKCRLRVADLLSHFPLYKEIILPESVNGDESSWKKEIHPS